MVRGDIGNFREPERTNSYVQPPLKLRFFAALANGPWVFLGVVLGVAVLFKVALSAAQTPAPEASAASETGTATATATPSATGRLRFEPDPAASPPPPSAPSALPARVRKPRRPR
jgi:hypothetical protein